MIDLDPAGKVRSVEQVLTEANFATVGPGASGNDILLKLGRPSERRRAHGNTELWAYRYDALYGSSSR